MKYRSKKLNGKDEENTNRDIRLEVIRAPAVNMKGNDAAAGDSSAGSTLFEPQPEVRDLTPTPTNSRTSSAYAPEKKLTLFALRLAIIEKTASGLGQLAFIWATVVLLGGFASSLRSKDFWYVTAILVNEGARLFSRSRELEWQHRSTRSISAAKSLRRIQSLLSGPRRLILASLRQLNVVAQPSRSLASKMPHIKYLEEPKRTWHAADVPLLPYSGWLFVSKNISRLLYWLQILAAAACVALSLMRLSQQDYGEGDQRNEKLALNLFYALALAEALMFFLEKGYWSWRIGYGNLLERVCEDCKLGPVGMISVRRFFYDSYSKCIDGSVFDGLKMDFVSFAEELLDSDSPEEQFIGARILQCFVHNHRFAGDTLRKIGSSTPVIDRLIEMLNWKDPEEEEIRRAAAQVVSKLTSKKQHALRVAAIPGAMESIASLLHTGGGATVGRPYEASPRAVVVDREDYEFTVFNLQGLLILKRLAQDHGNCWKIGNARGLLARIIDLTGAGPMLLRDERAPESRIKTVRRALQVLLNLVSATGGTGMTLRRKIAEIVYTVSNMRDVLQYGECHLQLQKLVAQILTGLAMDEEAREKIGATGGMPRLLLAVFFRPRVTDEEGKLCNEAGEALAMLLLDSPSNCARLLREGDSVVGNLVRAYADPVLRVNAGRLMRGLCAYSSPESSVLLRRVTEATPMVLKTIMEEKEKEKLLEVSIGLAFHLLRLSGHGEHWGDEIGRAGIKEEEFAGQLVQILRRYEHPESKVPRMRRFVVGLATALMRREEKYVKLFRELGFDEALRAAAETTSEMECFNVFSGSVGLSRHRTLLYTLVDDALELMAEKGV